jgi:hypothetical protein
MSVKEKEERHEPKLITVFYLFLLFCILIMIVYFFLSFLHPLFLHFFPHHSLILLSLFSLFSPLTEVSTIHLSFLITLTILDWGIFFFNFWLNIFLNLLSMYLCNRNGFHVKLLNPTCFVMNQQFNIQQLYVLPTLYLCVLYLSENKQRLVPLTA